MEKQIIFQTKSKELSSYTITQHIIVIIDEKMDIEDNSLFVHSLIYCLIDLFIPMLETLAQMEAYKVEIRYQILFFLE